MNYFNVIDTKFYNELRNGAAFGSNLTDFTNELVGNVDETVQVIRKITVRTEILATDFGTITHTQNGIQAIFNFSGNWFTEGISQGATVQLTWDNGTKVASETVITVTGNTGNNLTLTNTNILVLGFPDGASSDLEIIVTSAPNNIIYKYALNQLNANVNNYISPFDNNEQSYYATVTGSYQTFTRLTPNIQSWDLGTLEGKFNGTSLLDLHEFEFRHTFKIPYYVDGQISNVEDLIPPQNLTSTNTFKYGFGLFMAQTNFDANRVFEEAGFSGSVGYYNENFNGQANNYAIESLLYSNAHNTQTIEGTDTTTITFNIKKNSGSWAAGQKVIFKHSKLSSALEYQNKNTPFDTIWITDSLEQVEGAGAVSSSIITNCTVVIDGGDPTLLNVTLDTGYSASEQLLITSSKNWLMSLIVGDETLAVYASDRVMLKIDSQLWGLDTDVPGLVQNTNLEFINSWNTPKLNPTTNFTGWDGDFIGVDFAFQTKAQVGSRIRSAVFRLISYNTSNGIWTEINNTAISLSNGLLGSALTDPVITIYPYQLVNTNEQNSFNIQSGEDFNRIVLDSVQPVAGTVWQDWTGSLAFKVNWRDYVSASRPNVFYNASKPFNNLNELTSNYSNLNGYDVYGALDLTIGNSIGADTTYRLLSDPSVILPFGDNGGTGFSASVVYYDVNNDPTLNIYNNQNVRIEIELAHSSGLLAKLWGEIWIEAENGTQQEWRLSTHKDWTSPLNPLQPTDTLITGNTTLVEIVSVNNLVTLICQTNNANIIPNITDKVRVRLGTF